MLLDAGVDRERKLPGGDDSGLVFIYGLVPASEHRQLNLRMLAYLVIYDSGDCSGLVYIVFSSSLSLSRIE